MVLFTVSAIYHTGTWSPRVWAFLRRFDHSNIFLLIAGTYTPFSLILLDGTARVVLLSTVWSGAVLGVLFRVFWNDAPRWLYTPIYIALGWSAVFFMPAFFSGATSLGLGIGIAVFVMLVVGGALYTFGGVVYGFKRPNPWPRWFGFHEVFHTFTILAFVSHYVGISMATYALR
jgi:hemolysin III